MVVAMGLGYKLVSILFSFYSNEFNLKIIDPFFAVGSLLIFSLDTFKNLNTGSFDQLLCIRLLGMEIQFIGLSSSTKFLLHHQNPIGHVFDIQIVGNKR